VRAELEIARLWVSKARNDLLDADNNLASVKIPTDTVCFHCQQAAENPKLREADFASRLNMHPMRA
jgi:hypothetical protein